MAATDPFATNATGLDSPGLHAFAITPDDSNDLAIATRGIYVGVGGDVAVITAGGETVTFKNASAGTTLPIRAARVKATGTTATNLVGLY